jgi:GDP-L-fucose synthase
VPALIRRYVQAAADDAPYVTNWGTGTPRRELLHVDDMASACLHLLEHYDAPGQVNVGTGRDATVEEIAEIVAAAAGYDGETVWDSSMPDGMPRKLLDVTLLHSLGWTDQIGLAEGITSTVTWYREHADHLREVG